MIRGAILVVLGLIAVSGALARSPVPVVAPTQSQIQKAEDTLPDPLPPSAARHRSAPPKPQPAADVEADTRPVTQMPLQPPVAPAAKPQIQTNTADTAAAPATGNPASAAPVVMDARIGEQQDRTRLVIEVSDPVQLRMFTLNNPNRVVIDLPEVLWRLQNAQRPTGNGAVKSYRYGPFRPGNSRFVIDLNSPVSLATPMVLPPAEGYGYRIVLDLFSATQAQFDAKAGWPADLRAREAAAEHVAALPPAAPASITAIITGSIAIPAPKPTSNAPATKKIVVIDPGHGGIDTGTTGINGMQEKDLVLDEGLRLGRALAKRGYEVHFTRSTDIFIPLNERVAISRADHGDLFISLHADSNPDSGVNGLSIYTLSERGSDREAAALAKKENQSDIIAGVDLSQQDSPVASILIDLAQRDTINRSTRFASSALTQLSHTTDILPREPHRSAAFVVLKAPDVPAVLIELGYLSNPRDAAQMRTDGWRNGVAEAIASAVDRHFSPEPAVTAAQQGQTVPK